MKHELKIDRMVDGELSRDEQRVLLLSCESSNQWRDLALAYVESQAMQTELRELNLSAESGAYETIATSPASSAPRASDPKQSRPPETTMNLMSLAAAILVSLGLGCGLGWWWQDGAATNWASYPTLAPNENIATSDSTAKSDSANGIRSSPNASQVAVGKPKSRTQQKIQTVPFTVSDPNADELRQVDLPVVYASDLEPDWKERMARSGLSNKMLDDLRAQGLNVKQARTVTRVRLPDGRLVIVPIDYFFEHPFQ